MPGKGHFNRVRWVKKLVDEMGGTVMLDPMKFEYMSPLVRLVNQNVVTRRTIDRHNLSPLGRTDNAPVTHLWPLTNEPILTCVWDHAYGAKSPPMRSVTATLASGGLTRDRVGHVWAVPHDLGRPALAEEIAYHRDMTFAAIETSNAPNILLIGAHAIKMWRSDLRVTEVTGRVFRWRIGRTDYHVYPILHPGAVLADKQYAADWKRSLHTLSQGIHHGSTAWETDCMVCGEDVAIYDENAVPYCTEHFNPNNTTTKDKAWKKKAKNSDQATLDL